MSQTTTSFSHQTPRSYRQYDTPQPLQNTYTSPQPSSFMYRSPMTRSPDKFNDSNPDQQSLEARLAETRSQMESTENSFDQQTQQLGALLNDLTQEIERERALQKQVAERKTKETHTVETVVLKDIDAESRSRKNEERQQKKSVDSELVLLRQECVKEQKAMNDGTKGTIAVLKQKVDQVFKYIEEDKKAREHAVNNTHQKYMRQITELKQTLEQTQKNRLDSEKKLKDNHQALVDTFNETLAKERQEREETQEKILGILEETFSALESSLEH
ncbi:hypothetical protein BLNAU_118 [Blattamonas nauphoetae]|uniref:SWI5-dependent HO expression protein 3 n=1 Tax=Blattamonas nauphoetae TaxID=2049346 RepID=A0ABQ9YM32_9EUKA|nr:hypothetical protein BLNAU_118 [Blattamonas nauphoetae]